MFYSLNIILLQNLSLQSPNVKWERRNSFLFLVYLSKIESTRSFISEVLSCCCVYSAFVVCSRKKNFCNRSFPHSDKNSRSFLLKILNSMSNN